MVEVRGYKVFNPDWTCRGFQYEVGKTFEEDVTPECCERGFHFCLDLKDCFNYYTFNPDNKVAEVVALGEVDEEGDNSKCCTNKIQILQEISWEDVLRMVNTGKACTGFCNSGDWNSGNRNSGDCNSGDWNSGNRNSGDCNSGNRNSGDCNSGNWNSGDCNSGNRNSGNRNSGNRNSGDWNKANQSVGCFNTEDQKLRFFDKETDMSFEEWRRSRACYLLGCIDFRPTEWIDSLDMTDEEKENHPEYKTLGGYLRNRNTKDCCTEWWAELSDYNREVITGIPNFDATKFYEITGIQVESEEK